MAIIATDINYRLSGGSANATPITSLGGVKSSVAMSTGFFDDVTSAQASAGLTEYRCLYVHNNHGSLTLVGATVWIQANTTNTRIAVGLGTSAINATEQTVGSEATAPTSVTFATTPVNLATGLVIGDLPPGQSKAVWLRRTVAPGAALATDTFTLRVQGDTNP